MSKTYPIVDSTEALEAAFLRVRAAQEKFAVFSQEQVDRIFAAAALAAGKARIPLAKMAVEETGMGIVEDKVIKNHYAAENVFNTYKNVKTCGLIEEDAAAGWRKYAEPIGVLAAIIPTTNPTSTVVFKTLLALKTRNGAVIAAHPRAKECSIAAAKIVLEAAVAAGAPEDIIAWIDVPSLDLSHKVMRDADCILATGGPGMVRAAYSSGKPAIGVGAGNVPAVFDESADVLMAVNSVIHSKIFDNGVICASEQAIIVHDSIYEQVKQEFIKRNCYFLNADETEKVRKTIIINGALNAKIVGQKAKTIADIAGVDAPETTKILIGEVTSVDISEEFAHEKLSPVLAMYRYSHFDEALDMAERLIFDGGMGHTASIFANTITAKERLDAYALRMKACRILVNTPAAQGGIGDVYNFMLAPSLTLGCGSWGGNIVSENVGVKHLINYKIVAERRENMLWFRAPEKIYFKRGSLAVALDELEHVLNKKRAFIVTDNFLYENGYLSGLYDKLNAAGIAHTTFFDVEPDPTLATVYKGAALCASFKPDVIITLGGGSPMDAAKIIWLLYEHPDINFADMAMRFMDIRKRVYTFPKMGEKSYFIAIPTTSGTGSEVTPFAVITDEQTGIKYPIADYALMPNMAIIDPDLMDKAPRGLTAASGIDAVSHAMEAFASIVASDYTDAMAIGALKILFEYLPRAYNEGANDPIAREKVANGATMAGMAFANGFLGICHSMAHKLGGFFDLPHGIANALVLPAVIRYNAVEAPTRMGMFSQYPYPKAIARYAQIADELRLGGKTDEQKVELLITAFSDLRKKLDIKPTVRDYGIDEQAYLDKLDEMCEQAFDDQCTGANPRYPMIDEMKQMYLDIYYGN